MVVVMAMVLIHSNTSQQCTGRTAQERPAQLAACCEFCAAAAAACTSFIAAQAQAGGAAQSSCCPPPSSEMAPSVIIIMRHLLLVVVQTAHTAPLPTTAAAIQILKECGAAICICAAVIQTRTHTVCMCCWVQGTTNTACDMRAKPTTTIAGLCHICTHTCRVSLSAAQRAPHFTVQIHSSYHNISYHQPNQPTL